jgi:heme-degrading monooxygenase HmoA
MTSSTTTLRRRAALSTLPAVALAFAATPAGSAPLDDPDSVMTVMQFTARNDASRAELKVRMAAMRDHLRAHPGLLENALFENRNPSNNPHYVGVSRWKSFKDWESIWLNPKTQDLVRRIGEVGTLVPGTFAAVK